MAARTRPPSFAHDLSWTDGHAPRKSCGWAGWRSATASSSTARPTGPPRCAARRGRSRSPRSAKPELAPKLAARLPGLRGPLKLAEAMAVLPLVRRRLPSARLPFEDPRVVGGDRRQPGGDGAPAQAAPRLGAARGPGAGDRRRCRRWSPSPTATWPPTTESSTRRSPPTSRGSTTRPASPRSTTAAARTSSPR